MALLPDLFPSAARDPFEIGGSTLLRGLGTGARAARAVPYYSPEEQESLLRKAGRVATSGISTVGNILDLPGSVVREGISYLAGNSAANPFDQLAPWNWTNQEGRMTGRDLARQLGFADKQDTWGNFVGGIATEVATDPLTYFGGTGLVGKALTKAGVGLKGAGLLEHAAGAAASKLGVPASEIGSRFALRAVTVGDVLAEATSKGITDAPDLLAAAMKLKPSELPGVMSQNLAGTARFALPFSFGDEIVIGAGRNPNNTLLGKAANKVLNAMRIPKAEFHTPADRLFDAMRYSLPGRAVAATMSAPLMGRMSTTWQKYAPNLFERKRTAQWHVGADIMEAADQLKTAGLDDATSSLVLRASLEGALDTAAPLISQLTGAGPLKAEQMAVIGDVTNKLRGRFDAAWKRLQDLGAVASGPTMRYRKAMGGIDDLIEYASRYPGDVTGAKQGLRNASPVSMKDANLYRRYQSLRENAAGTVGVEAILRDPAIDAAIVGSRRQGHDAMVAAALGEIEGRYGHLYAGLDAEGNAIRYYPDKEGVLQDRLQGLAEYMVKHPLRRKSGLFTNHPLADAFRGLTGQEVRAEVVDAGYDVMAAAAREYKGGPGVPLGKIFQVSKLDKERGWQVLAQRMGMDLTGLDPRQMRDAKRALMATMIPQDVAEDFGRKWPKYTGPEADSLVLKAFDTFTNLFKAGVLSWPGRITRDLTSGQAQSMMRGMWWHTDARDFEKLMRGETVARAAEIPAIARWLTDHQRPLTDEEGSRAMRIIFGSHAAETGYTMRETPKPGQMEYAKGLDEMTKGIPGQQKITPLQSIKEIAGTAVGRGQDTSWNPFRIRGVFGAEETTFAPVKASERLSKYTDDMNRGVPWLNLMRKGYDADAAKRMVDAAQVSYDPATFSQFERQYLKRIFPFYSFSSRMFPHVLNELAMNPGGPMAQTIRQFNRIRDPSVATPDYVAETASIPWDTLPDQSKRYVTGLGFMFEDPLQFLQGGVRQPGMEALSRTNPLLKAPLEWITGRSFFQRGLQGGRALEEMDPTIGRTIANIKQLAGQPSQFVTGGSTAPFQRAKPFIGRPLEFALANSPLSRVLTTARTVTDPRKDILAKATLLGTGVRFTDVSPAAQEAILEERATELQKRLGARTFEKVWFPPEVRTDWTPEQQREAQALELLRKDMEQNKKRRRAAAQAQGRP